MSCGMYGSQYNFIIGWLHPARGSGNPLRYRGTLRIMLGFWGIKMMNSKYKGG